MLLDKIKDRMGSIPGNFGIYYIDLTTGGSCFAGNCDVFPASGTAKMMALIETFKRLENGTIQKNDTYTLKKENYITNMVEDYQPSYGALDFLHEGLVVTIEDLYRLMITVSDNMAFNILLNMYGIDEINKTFELLGFKDTRLNRLMFDLKKAEKGIENYISVHEMAIIFERLYKGNLISGRASKEMIFLLKRHQRTNIIPYYFPEKLEIAHQTGFDEGIIHDFGIIYTEKPFILCMSASNTDTRKAESIMRDITLICHKNSLNLSE